MKVALLIAGYLRSFKDNIANIKRYITDTYDTDIYIHITRDTEKKYLNSAFSIEELYRHFQPKMVILMDNMAYNKPHENIYNQNYKFFLLNRHRQDIARQENIKYDVIVKLRPDVNLQQDFDFYGIRPNTLYIPDDCKIDKSKLTNSHDPFLCDIIAYGDSRAMNWYFGMYECLDSLISRHGPINETLLYCYLTENHIPYVLFPYQYVVILSQVNTIAITGDSGCGKTILSNIIQRVFENSFVLECDRYHKWERGDEQWQHITHLNPDANYIAKMNDDVFDLKIGNSIYQVDYDHGTGRFTDKQLIESKENIIICGLHTLYISEHILSLKIFIDADDTVRIPWKVQRDIAKRGYSVDRILAQIEARKGDYLEYIYPQRANSDMVVSFFNTDPDFDLVRWISQVRENSGSPPPVIEFQYKIGINKKYPLNPFLENLGGDVDMVGDFYWLSFDTPLHIKNTDSGGVFEGQKSTALRISNAQRCKTQKYEDIITKTILSFFSM